MNEYDQIAENGTIPNPDGSKLSIKVNIADRYYPLRIVRKDEEKIRSAAKRINEKVLYYKQRYADRDVQDALSMATLQFVIKLLELEEERTTPPIVEELNRLDKELGDYLDSFG
ncbi:MAG: cell division protein ZapA [Prevotellaceae bacterium]|jgi:cell division protein ZapA|nr:cell division protein ZapA [Prevotellaceae bacterium]